MTHGTSYFRPDIWCVDVTTRGERTEMYGDGRGCTCPHLCRKLRVSSLWVPGRCLSWNTVVPSFLDELLQGCGLSSSSQCALAYVGWSGEAQGWFSWEKMLCVAKSGGIALTVPPDFTLHCLSLGKPQCCWNWCVCPTYQEYVTTLGPGYPLTNLHLIFVKWKRWE